MKVAAVVSLVLLAGCVDEPAVDGADGSVADPSPPGGAQAEKVPPVQDPEEDLPDNRSAEPVVATEQGVMSVFLWNPNLPPLAVGDHGPYAVSSDAATNGLVAILEWQPRTPLTENMVLQSDHNGSAAGGGSPLRMVLEPPIDRAVQVEVFPLPVSGHAAGAVDQAFTLTFVTFQDSVFDANITV